MLKLIISFFVVHSLRLSKYYLTISSTIVSYITLSLMRFILRFWHFLHRVLRFLWNHLKATIAVLVLCLIALAVFAVTRPKQPEYITGKVERVTVRQLVEAVGTVTSERDLALQFTSLDVVSQVFVKEGDRVKAGQTLATLRSGMLGASIASARAQVDSANAALQALVEGARPENIAISEAQVLNKKAALDAARESLSNAEKNLVTTKNQLAVIQSEAKTSLSGYVNSAASTAAQQLANSKSALQAIQGVFNANDVQDALVKNAVSDYSSVIAQIQGQLSDLSRKQSEATVQTYDAALTMLSSVRSSIDSAAISANRAYDIIANLPVSGFLTNVSKETNKTTLSTQKSLLQSSVATLDATIKQLRDASASYDTRIAAQESSLVSQEGIRDRAKADILTYETSLQIDQAQLALMKAPPRQTDINAAKARVNQAKADLSRAASQYNDTVLTAPVDGVITKVNVKKGEIRPSTEPSITILGTTPLRTEMFVSEVDIPYVLLGQTGSITLDAFRSEEIPMKVTAIDQAATDRDGVSKYRVLLDFVQQKDGLKVGMTGDASIVTGTRENVLAIPARAVLEKDGKKIVRILLPKNEIEERIVTTGLEGEGGLLEVEGLEEGEEVIVLIKQ